MKKRVLIALALNTALSKNERPITALISWSLRTSTFMEILSRRKPCLQIFGAHHTSSVSPSTSTVAIHACPCFVVLAHIDLHGGLRNLWQ